jgi:hypothetical protein
MRLGLHLPRRERPARVVYVGSHEDKLSRLPAMRIDPDDDGRTREDVIRARAEQRAWFGFARRRYTGSR